MTNIENIEVKPHLDIGSEVKLQNGQIVTVTGVINSEKGRTQYLVMFPRSIGLTTSVWETQICPNTSSLKSS